MLPERSLGGTSDNMRVNKVRGTVDGIVEMENRTLGVATANLLKSYFEGKFSEEGIVERMLFLSSDTAVSSTVGTSTWPLALCPSPCDSFSILTFLNTLGLIVMR